MDDLVVRILEEKTFRKLEANVHRIGRALTVAASERLRTLASGLSLGIDYSLALRGSHARGSADRHSDVDVVLLADPDFEAYSAIVRELLENIDPSLYSLHFYPTRVDPSQVSLSQWLSLPHLSYVTGNRINFRHYKVRAQRTLQSKTLDELLDMLDNDPLRGRDWQQPQSYQFAHLKRGTGTILDAEFFRLLHLWTHVTAVPTTKELSEQLSCAGLYSRYLDVLKPALRGTTRSPVETFRIASLLSEDSLAALPWFLHPEIAEQVVVAHHSLLLDFISWLKENSRNVGTSARISQLCAIQR